MCIFQQIESFLRNTKKMVREKKLDGGQSLREIAQMNADGQRLIQEMHLKTQASSERIIQDLQDVSFVLMPAFRDLMIIVVYVVIGVGSKRQEI